jgi:hypothetical protein
MNTGSSSSSLICTSDGPITWPPSNCPTFALSTGGGCEPGAAPAAGLPSRALLALPYFSFAQGLRRNRS